jgi:hypothetical protein
MKRRTRSRTGASPRSSSSRKLRSSSVFVVFDVFGERQGERGKEEERAVRERRNGKESAGERNVGERNEKENEKIKK